MSGLRVLPRGISLRARLTLIYGAMFLVAGLVLLGTTYALFNQNLMGSEPGFSTSFESDAPNSADEEAEEGEREIVTNDGGRLTGDDADQWLQNEQERIRDSATTSLITQGSIALVVVGGAAMALGWFVAGRVLAPMSTVTDTARRIAAAPAADRVLHERISLDGPDDEVKELADTFDTMVARLDRSFDGQRRFVANASHELRTPLTLGRGLVEVAMRRSTASEDVKRLGEDLLQINARHERLISGLLLLANSDNEITERHPVDLADVVTHVVAQTAGEATQAGVTVSEDTAEAMIDGDAVLLERLVHNVIENAIRHNVEHDGWVRAECATDGGSVELVVSNSGPVIPSYEVAALFEPFRRLKSERLVTAKGVGLGLSIVLSIAQAHGGTASAQARDAGGLVVTVALPRH